jgi:ribosomal-protein-alanine N-acetyltransferase
MKEIIRLADKNDIDAVFRIEREQVRGTWKREYFENELVNDISYFFVIETQENNEIIGFIIFWIIDEIAELHSIAIDEKYKKSGFATKLIYHMYDLIKANGVNEIFLEVRASNKAAISLYKKKGFKEIAKINNYYKNPKEDAIVFKRICC